MTRRRVLRLRQALIRDGLPPRVGGLWLDNVDMDDIGELVAVWKKDSDGTCKHPAIVVYAEVFDPTANGTIIEVYLMMCGGLVTSANWMRSGDYMDIKHAVEGFDPGYKWVNEHHFKE